MGPLGGEPLETSDHSGPNGSHRTLNALRIEYDNSISERWRPIVNVPPAVSHAVLVHPPSPSNAMFPSSPQHAAASLDLECLETFNVRLGPL